MHLKNIKYENKRYAWDAATYWKLFISIVPWDPWNRKHFSPKLNALEIIAITSTPNYIDKQTHNNLLCRTNILLKYDIMLRRFYIVD